MEQIAQELEQDVCQLAVPEVEKYIHDERIRDLWLSGYAPWTTDFARVRSLSVLLKAIGPVDLVATTLEELQRLSSGDATLTRLTKEHIRKLEGWYPDEQLDV